MAHETAVYTHGHHDSVLRSHRARTAANSAAYLVPELRPDARVLDIGCGPGTITADLAALVAQGSVTGLDAAEGVLETARATAAERGLSNVEFTTGDVHALAFPDAAFDVVHAHQTLQHVGDPVAALREMRRVCAPGGLVAVRDADYGGMFWYPEVPVLDEWLDLYRRVAVSNGGVPDAGRRLHAWAREAGFANVTLSTSTWTFSSPEERAWWSGLWAERTVASSYAGIAVGAGLADREDLERISAAWRTWGEQEDAWFTVVHGEILCRV
ncbi:MULTISPECIES: methyltransferase domain-containing protein [unclassified Streptomyces]|uniref:class I SAM-dependent methyltransferase n=1 Tax=unclassified Streptomyces TaxID=2593676 RepID=UPI002DDAC866|nr:methyltransferase domain-containing protein [Streptomyces sp. NBC_01795]WSA91478.1 methyltransferase domain-containing protein [Streptomyces sp. NBC_01795]WSS44715.1 methyltransferase domain-containing protein [Streptomyces sp. NBC_01187]